MGSIQTLAIGLGMAGYYALVAVGFGLIFATLRIFHVAHGTVFVTGGYVFFFLHRLYGFDLATSAAIAVACAAILGVAIDRVIYIPIMRRGGGMFAVFIASLGVALIFDALYLVLTKGVLAIARTDSLQIWNVGAIALRQYDMAMVVLVLVIFLLLYLWLHRTRTGLEIRALTDNEMLAGTVGMNVDRTRNSIFLIASAMAGLAGVLTAYDNGINPDSGNRTLFIAVVAVILGGVRNLLAGTLLGSVALGIITAFAMFLYPEWVTFCIFAMMIVLILFRPKGLFG
ncbi:branched-chain amino acid ABC transporter permease [Roseiarcaceae bacterium H3SJ34-1]|uniref:branched-chain amino acid ABC transporter permease n=1 Tax=Terripilifer ovatus TaxID=3032367 RepID=UPI003AB9A1A4|nr:branched-chain amino acid ABC transporter permease [Roseiarcaceae bacterium H3SJ34-1]